MVSINYASREVSCKIVYYGPGLSGKTTNLQYVHAKIPKKTRGDLISLATDADRTLYFDFLPIDIGNINGLAVKFQLYTVPGQVFYNATRKLVLRGVDGLVFVADSQRSKREENIESLNNLKENLLEYGYNINVLTIVLQYNKRDLPEILSIAELEADLNWNHLPYYEASAVSGHGVFDTLKLITKLVLASARKSSQTEQVGALSGDSGAWQLRQQATAGQQGASSESLPPGVIVAGREVATPPLGPVEAAAAHRGAGHPSATTSKVAAGTAVAAPRRTIEEIERNLQPIGEEKTSSVKKTLDEKSAGGDGELSSAHFADTFEVPRVISMQKSLKVKRKKRSFFLFRLFMRDKE